ncbi:hypothetical protein ROI_10160 [Roseburia intestinalis M50/1]|nr:hypothetical protein ROI_10160 [Roseburia intestinalis M50/1]
MLLFFIHFESGQQRSYWYDVIRTVEGLYHNNHL